MMHNLDHFTFELLHHHRGRRCGIDLLSSFLTPYLVWYARFGSSAVSNCESWSVWSLLLLYLNQRIEVQSSIVRGGSSFAFLSKT